MPDSAAIKAASAAISAAKVAQATKTGKTDFIRCMEAALAGRIMALTNSNLGM